MKKMIKLTIVPIGSISTALGALASSTSCSNKVIDGLVFDNFVACHDYVINNPIIPNPASYDFTSHSAAENFDFARDNINFELFAHGFIEGLTREITYPDPAVIIPDFNFMINNNNVTLNVKNVGQDHEVFYSATYIELGYHLGIRIDVSENILTWPDPPETFTILMFAQDDDYTKYSYVLGWQPDPNLYQPYTNTIYGGTSTPAINGYNFDVSKSDWIDVTWQTDLNIASIFS